MTKLKTEKRFVNENPTARRYIAFIDRLKACEPGVPNTLEIYSGSAGQEESGRQEPAIMIHFVGDDEDNVHPFTIEEAKFLTEMIEAGIEAMPSDPNIPTLADIVMSIKEASRRSQDNFRPVAS